MAQPANVQLDIHTYAGEAETLARLEAELAAAIILLGLGLPAVVEAQHHLVAILGLDLQRALLAAGHLGLNLPDIIKRWHNRTTSVGLDRTAQSFLVPKAEIVGNDYDLSINRYKQVVYEEVQHESPQKILAELKALEAEIMRGMDELEGMLS